MNSVPGNTDPTTLMERKREQLRRFRIRAITRLAFYPVIAVVYCVIMVVCVRMIGQPASPWAKAMILLSMLVVVFTALTSLVQHMHEVRGLSDKLKSLG